MKGCRPPISSAFSVHDVVQCDEFTSRSAHLGGHGRESLRRTGFGHRVSATSLWVQSLLLHRGLKVYSMFTQCTRFIATQCISLNRDSMFTALSGFQ